MTIENNAVQVQEIAFIDLEASSLGSNSYPSEIGWAVIHEDGSVESGSCLIRPPAKWKMYENAWNPASARLTGITKSLLDRDGLPPSEALKRFFDSVRDRELFSDEPDYDAYWLQMLADAAAIPLDGRKLGDAKKLIERMGLTVRFDEPPRHRAEADARRFAAAFAKALRLAQP
jgi:hypothetical protein